MQRIAIAVPCLIIGFVGGILIPAKSQPQQLPEIRIEQRPVLVQGPDSAAVAEPVRIQEPEPFDPQVLQEQIVALKDELSEATTKNSELEQRIILLEEQLRRLSAASVTSRAFFADLEDPSGTVPKEELQDKLLEFVNLTPFDVASVSDSRLTEVALAYAEFCRETDPLRNEITTISRDDPERDEKIRQNLKKRTDLASTFAVQVNNLIGSEAARRWSE
jgi:peptidoglycan hydrolase CwlO-like protein